MTISSVKVRDGAQLAYQVRGRVKDAAPIALIFAVGGIFFAILNVPVKMLALPCAVLGLVVAFYWLAADGLSTVGLVGFGSGAVLVGIGLLGRGGLRLAVIVGVCAVFLVFVFLMLGLAAPSHGT